MRTGGDSLEAIADKKRMGFMKPKHRPTDSERVILISGFYKGGGFDLSNIFMPLGVIDARVLS